MRVVRMILVGALAPVAAFTLLALLLMVPVDPFVIVVCLASPATLYALYLLGDLVCSFDGRIERWVYGRKQSSAGYDEHGEM